MMAVGFCERHYQNRYQPSYQKNRQPSRKPGSPFIFLGRVYRHPAFVCRLAECGHGRVYARDRCRPCYYRWRCEDPGYRERRRASNRRSKAKNENQQTRRRSYLRQLYGLSVEEFDAIVVSQSGVCAICPTPVGHTRDTHVDHDHTTGAVRGLLCRRCNRALGLLKDDERWLKSAIRYLERALSL